MQLFYKKRPRKLNSSGALKNALNGGNISTGSSDNRPSKPRELLYSRHINQVKLLFFIQPNIYLLIPSTDFLQSIDKYI